jgi:hypothetical protein
VCTESVTHEPVVPEGRGSRVLTPGRRLGGGLVSSTLQQLAFERAAASDVMAGRESKEVSRNDID